MRLHGVRRRFVLWLASFALLVGALMPVLTAARPAEPDWLQICTALHGSVSGPAAPDRPLPATDTLFAHCPYCSLHFADIGMPPAALREPALRLSFAAPSACIAAAPTLRFWSDALSRGPPPRPES